MTTVPKPTSLASTYTCAYDAWNKLVEVKSGATVVAKYEYDGLSRRVKKHLDSRAPGSPEGVDTYRHVFYSSSWQILETRKTTTENDPPESLDPEWQFVWSVRYVDAAVCRDENKDGDGDCVDGSDERVYYLADANMNVTCLVDAAGDALERYTYDPYGKAAVLDADFSADADGVSDYANAVLYCGYWRDAETGLLHVRHRTLHPSLGRWLQRDPVGYVDGMSLYQYVRSNPSTLTDAQGLWAQNIHELATKRWATQVGYPNVGAAAVGAADNAVDNWNSSTGWVPYAGDQGYHFNRNLSGGEDSRMQRYKKHLFNAKIECLYRYQNNDNPEKAAKELGTALHPYQDWVAHGDYGIYDKGQIWDRHNAFSPQKEFGDPYDYPDDPLLDAKNSADGRPVGLALKVITTNWGMSVREYAIYERGMKRYRLTMEMTKSALNEFRKFVQKNGGCKCKEYFGVK